MNYSNKTYGRKVIKSDVQARRLLFLMGVCVLIGVLIGALFTGLIANKKSSKNYQLGQSKDVVFAENKKLDWNGSELNFVPLDVPLDEELQEYIYCLSYSYNIDYSLIMAMIDTESNYKADIISKTNDYGLMQINKLNHKWLKDQLGITSFLDPRQNIKAGVFVLSKLFEANGDNTTKVLMAYNMGQSGAEKFWKQDIHSTKYTEKIIKKQFEFKKQLLEKRR